MIGGTLERKTIYKCYVGSIAHNLYVPASENEEFGTCDKDTMEFFTYNKDYYLGFDGYNRTGDTYDQKKGVYDMVGHELRKAMWLLMKGNPNLLVTLFNNPKSYMELSTGGKMLLQRREWFLSAKNVRARFAGFAYSQLHQMKKSEFKGYMGEKRKELVEKYGYDTKNAMTLIRLLREGIELLETGRLTIYKMGDERQLLLDIKTAKYTLEEVQQMADEYFAKLDEAYEKTVLPQDTERGKINKLLVDILEAEVFNY